MRSGRRRAGLHTGQATAPMAGANDLWWLQRGALRLAAPEPRLLVQHWGPKCLRLCPTVPQRPPESTCPPQILPSKAVALCLHRCRCQRPFTLIAWLPVLSCTGRHSEQMHLVSARVVLKTLLESLLQAVPLQAQLILQVAWAPPHSLLPQDPSSLLLIFSRFWSTRTLREHQDI